MRRLSLLFTFPLLLLTGCPFCGDGELQVVEGSAQVAPGASIQFVFRYDGDTYSAPGACGGHWYVNGVEGGTDATGTISGCGHYTAPSDPPSDPPLIEAAQYPVGTCADCCPYASMHVNIASGS